MNGTEIRVHLAPWSDSLEVLILERTFDRRYVGNVVMQAVEEGTLIEQPSLRLTQTAAQQLMDNLWQCGLRPTEGTGSAGAMAATQKHLEDMRRLVFEEPQTRVEVRASHNGDHGE